MFQECTYKKFLNSFFICLLNFFLSRMFIQFIIYILRKTFFPKKFRALVHTNIPYKPSHNRKSCSHIFSLFFLPNRANPYILYSPFNFQGIFLSWYPLFTQKQTNLTFESDYPILHRHCQLMQTQINTQNIFCTLTKIVNSNNIQYDILYSKYRHEMWHKIST